MIERKFVVLGGAVLLLAGAAAGAAERRAPAPEAPEAAEHRVVEVGRAPYLGVHLREETGSEGGARIVDVVPDSPAARAGLEEDDVIVSFGGATVRGPAAVTEKLRAREPGDVVKIGVLRGTQRKEIEVEIGRRAERALVWKLRRSEADAPDALEAPEPPELPLELDEHLRELGQRLGREGAAWRVLPVPGAWNRPRLGVQLVETTPELRGHLGGGEDAGVLVSKVLPGTPAERAGIHVGDLILSVEGQDVATSGELIEALEGREGTIKLRVARDRRPMTIEVQLPEPEERDLMPSGPRASARPAPRPRPMPARPPLPPPPPAPAPPAAPALIERGVGI